MPRFEPRFATEYGWAARKLRTGRLPDISNNIGPVKLFLKTLLSFHLKEFFSFVFLSFSFFSASTTTARL
jgi:hypothetical protein